MQPRTAFYPCCCLDVTEPLGMLSGVVDVVVFCDKDARLLPKWSDIRERLTGRNLPSPVFICDDARASIDKLDRVDVLFYRRDSEGEGGSGVYVLSQWFLPLVLNKMPSEGGLIITDGSNSRKSLFRKMTRDAGYTKFGWQLGPTRLQPYLVDHGLHQIAATPIAEHAR